MAELKVNVPNQPTHYPLKIKKALLDQIGQEIKAIYKQDKVAVVTDQNVYDFYGERVRENLEKAGFDVKMIVLEAGEQTKSMTHLNQLYSEFIDFNLGRGQLMVALGGGVIGDLAGFAAASYLRGIPYVQIPTTLLAQVDSSVGGKVAVDLPEGKNLAGAFYHPKLVLIDPEVLRTLEDPTFSDGMAEVIKYACIRDAGFFDQLATYDSRAEIMEDIEEIIYTCCNIKSQVVEEDEKDLSQRMVLNYGHTLGHAIEAHYRFQDYTHGQAISIGMVAINQIAENLGLSPSFSSQQIELILKKSHLPTQLKNPADYQHIVPLIKNDKKNLKGSLKVVILDQIGKARILETDLNFFDPLLEGDL